MMEIALCLAIVGFALVAIIGVLPYGMNTQRDNREETVINQDATVLLEAIRSAARGGDYLTNYVVAITNYWTDYNANGTVAGTGVNGYTYAGANENGNSVPAMVLTNGANIIGLLSTPEYLHSGLPVSGTAGVAFMSNRVVATVRSISGLAAEKPPQDNQIMREDTLTYRLVCVNAPMAVDTNSFNPFAAGSFATQLAASQRELRLTFLWPLFPNGNVGSGRQTFRVTIAGQLTPENFYGNTHYFYQPQVFVP